MQNQRRSCKTLLRESYYNFILTVRFKIVFKITVKIFWTNPKFMPRIMRTLHKQFRGHLLYRISNFVIAFLPFVLFDYYAVRDAFAFFILKRKVVSFFFSLVLRHTFCFIMTYDLMLFYFTFLLRLKKSLFHFRRMKSSKTKLDKSVLNLLICLGNNLLYVYVQHVFSKRLLFQLY